MSKNEVSKSNIGTWRFVTFLGLALVVLSMLGGVFILDEIGTTVIGAITGIAVMVQGLIFGTLMVAFSKLGISVESIERKIDKE